MNNKNKRTNQKGFTLIELMIVVAIIGVLSAIAVPAYKNYVTKSELSSGLATMRSLITPAELIFQEKGSISSATPITDLGTVSSASSLGTISIDTENEIKFTFNDTSSVNAATLKFSRSTNGWTCENSKDSDVSLDGC
ncbi:pilin [Vibrio sp. 10N.286.52.C3]|uniref:pilin n=1 Tax=Vibrio sp. 10N.286.52.C3 TaxID=3229713 RepID=UPI00354CD60C